MASPDITDGRRKSENPEDQLTSRLEGYRPAAHHDEDVRVRRRISRVARTEAQGSVRHDISDVAGIRVVPFQHDPPANAVEQAPELLLRHFNQEDFKKIDGKDLSMEELKPDTEDWSLNNLGERVLGYTGRGRDHVLDGTYDSFNYTSTSNVLSRVSSLWRGDYSSGIHNLVTRGFKRYFIVFIIAIVTALVGVGIDQSIEYLSTIKYRELAKLFNEAFLSGVFWRPLGFSLAWNLAFSFLAAMVVFISPVAQGSGIPQVKCYLNGIKVPFIVRIKTLVCKATGVIFSVVAGFAVGKEGPMIHSGAAIGAGLSQGKSTSLKFTTSYFKDFRNDKEKRDFVAAGAAAGVAAAFGSPMGGILFAIEEGASHFNRDMLWRVAICSYTSYNTLSLVNSFILGIPGQLSNGGLISFGHFSDATYNLYSVLIFMIMGIFGAISGALFNSMNKHLTKFRVKFVHISKWYKVCEVLLCGMVVALLAFDLTTFDDSCESVVVSEEQLENRNSDHVSFRMNCAFVKENSAANLWYKTPEATVKALFHDEFNTHNWKTLLQFGGIYWLLSCWTYGMGISNGLFIPCLLVGATWGRCVGIFLKTKFPDNEWGDVGNYALVGACAQLAGVVRLTFSLTAIVTDAIGNNTYLFPVMITTIVSKHLGDIYNKGLYDIHIDLAGIPLLEDEPPVDRPYLTTRHIMSKYVRYLPICAKVKDLVHMLKTTSHNAFPVVDTPAKPDDPFPTYGRLRGLVTRHDIITMINNKVFCRSADTERPHRESWETLRAAYPRYPTVSSIKLSDQEQETSYLDFTLSMNLAPLAINYQMSHKSAYELMRNIGVRHLVVVNHQNEVVGMVTRKDLCSVETAAYSVEDRPVLKRKTTVIPVRRTVDGCRSAFQELFRIGRFFRKQHDRLIEDPEEDESPICESGDVDHQEENDMNQETTSNFTHRAQVERTSGNDNQGSDEPIDSDTMQNTEPRTEEPKNVQDGDSAYFEPDPEAKFEGEPEADLKLNPKPDLKVEPKSEHGAESKANFQPDLKTESRADFEPDPEPNLVAEAKEDPGAYFEPNPEASPAPNEAGDLNAEDLLLHSEPPDIGKNPD